MQLALAPIAYYWDKSKVAEFYEMATHWPVEIIYLGEVVCSRRHQLRLDDWIELASHLRSSGKQVVLSSMTLIDNEADRRAMNKLVERAGARGLMIEANDYSAVRALQGQAFVAGMHLNCYHADTLLWLAELGACRFVAPLELSATDLVALLPVTNQRLDCELQVWGRMALAHSSRCFTARHHRLRKDACEFKCAAYPDGLAVRTQESQHFLNLNGIQTQSASCLDLGRQLPELAGLGVEVLRIQPQSVGTDEIVQSFALAMQESRPAYIAEHCLTSGTSRSNGYWQAQAGMNWVGS